jgi:hypothetical protein
MKNKLRWLTIPALVLILAVVAFYAPQNAKQASSAAPGNRVLAHALAVELGQAKQAPHQQYVSSGVLYALLQASGVLAQRAKAYKGPAPKLPSSLGTQGCQNVFHGSGATPDNVRMNQDCSFRRQAEEVVVPNPLNPQNLIGGQNDSRLGFNHCGYDWSFDGGKTWGDQLPPFWQFVNLDGVTFDACSDPTATFDAAGNAYVGGVLFELSLADSAFTVAKSNAPIGGAFYHSPLVQPFQIYSDVPLGVVANDNDPNIFNDKEFIVADNGVASPKSNFVYATWTRFNFNTGAGVGANSPIYFSQSTDGGATWSPGAEISGANAAICTAFSGEPNPNACDQDQGSHPVVGKDGTVYVAFGNGNTPTAGINQHLIVKCGPGSDCTNPASWSAPVKISDDYGIQPVGPDPNTGCPGGRTCLPPNGYRLDDFVEGSVSVDNSGKLYFAWADGRNLAPNCQGNASGATPPCDNDVFYSYSTDGGATWSAAFDLTPASKFNPNAQWMPWSAVSPDGKTLWVAYYDRSYGNCENTGCNDITLAKVSAPATGNPKLKYTRVTTSSMPNLIPGNNPLQAGFLGDYMWVSVDNQGHPYISWADTRGLNQQVEEDVYYAKFKKFP